MKPTFAHARDKREVLLDDGRLGRLQHITKESRVATIVIGGRRYRMPAKDLSVISTHKVPIDGIMGCCNRSVAEARPDDRFTEAAASVTCPGSHDAL